MGCRGGLRSASLHSGPSHRFAAGPSPYTEGVTLTFYPDGYIVKETFR